MALHWKLLLLILVLTGAISEVVLKLERMNREATPE